MVIQRSWKAPVENLQHPSNNNNSSDDSNGSNQTLSSTNTNSSKSQNAKSVTTPQMAENVLSRLKQRFGTQITGQKSSSEAVMRSLELLRINVQMAFDKEIDQVVKKFMDVYFKPAFKNIKENLGEHSVSDDVLQKMSCALLENSKAQYNTRTRFALANTPHEIIILKPETSTQTLNSSLKRTYPLVEATSTMAATSTTTEIAVQPPAKKPASSSSVQIQQRLYVQHQPRRQIFWNTSAISTETQFILDVQANQAFGFGTDGKERLASKHPELIRYLPDGQDRDWLVQQKIIPAQNRNSRFLFLVYDEVIKLGQSEDYRHKDSLNLDILHAFKIPNFIIQKMKTFFIDLNIKSRGLITNSYSSPVAGSHLRNALLQGSHLATSVGSSPIVVATVTSVGSVTCGGNMVATSTLAAASSSGSDGGTVVKMKRSLSSSHATLTALLNNSNGENQNASDTNNINI